jgi:hypothetical protein
MTALLLFRPTLSIAIAWYADNPDPVPVWVSEDLRKATAAPAGSRWITVHPNGKDEKGVPVLIQETKQGSGVFHVVGGAGGKLNYLKLRGVKSESQYKEEAARRQTERREEAKKKRQEDKESGLYQAKQQARKEVEREVKRQERELIATVAQAMGWQGHEFDEAAHTNLSDSAMRKARTEHHRKWLSEAKGAIDLQRQRLLADADARAEALGQAPLETADDQVIAVDDLDLSRPSEGIGFAPDYKGRAADQGSDQEKVRAEAEAIDTRGLDDDALAGRRERRERAAQIQTELEGMREESPLPKELPKKILDAQQAVELMKAQKRLEVARRQASKMRQEIDEKGIERKAYVIEVGNSDPELEESVRDQIESDLRTVRTRAFLSEVKDLGGEDFERSLSGHLVRGAFRAINSVAITAGGDALLDRSVVDVLGVSGAAKVLARRLHSDLSESEVSEIALAMEAFHSENYLQATEAAMLTARELVDAAKAVRLEDAHDASDLAMAQEMNAKRREAIVEARKVLGGTLGEMEANAAMVLAFKQGAKDKIEVPLGEVSSSAAVQQLRALGLGDGDYEITVVGTQRFATINADGMDRLAKPVPKDELRRYRKAMDIIEGRADEPDWLPKGMAQRPDLAVKTPPGVAQRLAVPFEPGEDLGQSIKDYIGGRIADGDTPADVIADLLSQEMAEKTGGRENAYFEALRSLVPMKGEDGKMIRAESYQGQFEEWADAFVEREYGGRRDPLHRQNVPVDEVSVDALHRALSKEPAGTIAYKPVGDVTRSEQGKLRDWWAKEVGSRDEQATRLREELKAHEQAEPEKEVEDMFGVGTNPEWTEWRQKRDQLAEEYNAADLSWGKYVKVMGGPARAYAAVQDLIRGRVANEFAQTYNTLRPDSPLKVGRTVIAGNLNHLDAVDPQAREARLEKQRALVDSLRARDRGQYASGSVTDRLERARESLEAMAQSQMGFFSTEPEEAKDKPLGTDERHTLGHAAERRIAAMMGEVGRNFKPGEKTALWQASMSGKYINQQRGVKLIEANKRLVLAQGVGSGKTVIQLAGFTHLQQQGKAKRGLFIVPSIVQGQFGGEALRYLEPGKFKWHIEPGASREERIAAYRDPETHFSVVTHQAFRDDMVAIAAEQAGIDANAMADKVRGMSVDERKAWMRKTMDAAGINHDYLAIDEGHDLLNRAGKQDSLLANVIDSVAHNVPYYVSATADPIKNDPSEIYSLLEKMDPSRYSDRKAFLRRYGQDTAESRDALRREMVRYMYPGRIDPGIKASKHEVPVELSPEQKQAIETIDKSAARGRLARLKGGVDIEAMRSLSPQSFDGIPEEQHEEVARRLQRSIGITRAGAVRRAIDAHPSSGKLTALDAEIEKRAGKPGVVFARSLSAVHSIAERLRAQGHRVAVITGDMSSKEKYAARLKFKPESGDPEADILVASDAGSVGLNAQRGQWLIQYDLPDTAKTKEQRDGRINRLGQKNNIDLVTLMADHPIERAARKRLESKYELRDVLTQPFEGLDDSGLAAHLSRVRVDREQAGLF